MMANLGFIGLGLMGNPMCRNLIRGGHRLFVRDAEPQAMTPLTDLGATGCKTCREVLDSTDVVFIVVPDTPDVADVLFGPGGAAVQPAPGKIIVDMSSISPLDTKDFALRLAERGMQMLDAPVSGGEVGAESGTLSIMVGGSAEVLAQVRPYLELMGNTITHIGDHGAGQTAKVANQIIVALNLEAICEALLFASKAGADPERVRKALMGGAANSRLLEIKGEWILSRRFQPGFRVKHQQKDLNNALNAARKLGLMLPNTATTQELYNAVSGDGGSDLDHCAVILALERMANHKVT
jgi:2-hydroxy-3-oxopropionate reductase